jgi:hypothetical protein
LLQKSLKNVAEKFGGKGKMRTFAARLRKTATKKFLKRLAQKKMKNFAKRFGDLKIMRTFAARLRKTAQKVH